MEYCDVTEDRQKWEISRSKVGNLVGHQIKADSGRCLGVDSACNDGSVELLSCDDPETQWIWVGLSFNSYYCWLYDEANPSAIDFDACGGFEPYLNDDEFYYNNLYFFDECVLFEDI